MLVAFISDVHGNLPALEAVVEKLEACDEIYCCGDVVGYYPFPNEVVELLISLDVKSVLGNHDYAVLTNDFTGFNSIAREAGVWTVKHISDRSLDYLAELPFSIKTELFEIYHGMPGEGLESLFEYVFPEDDLEYLIDDRSVVVGHSHIQFVRWFNSLNSQLDPFYPLFFLNPGSVGQPRDGDPRAAYALLDTESWKVKLERTKYNIEEVCEAVEKAGLPDFLCERLYRGV